jgi:hypothetical protein
LGVSLLTSVVDHFLDSCQFGKRALDRIGLGVAVSLRNRDAAVTGDPCEREGVASGRSKVRQRRVP